ncbi:MAG: cell division protein FtsA [Dehalococcoidia bacterium]
MALKRSGTVAAIDVGTTKVCTLIGDLDPEGRPRVLGVGVTASRGMKRGAIDDMVEVTAAIRRSIQVAEASAGGLQIGTATVGVAGAHVGGLNTKGLTAITHPNRPIADDDVERALDSARTITIPSNREVIHVLPRHYVVDGAEQVSNPVGMHGHRLDVDAHVITGTVNAMQNLKRCVTAAGVDVDQLVLQQLASVDAVLDDEERRHGVIVADIGGGTTDIAIILNGAVYHTSVLPVGGDNITNDLVVGIRTPFHAAEEAKEIYGHGIPSAVNVDEMVELDAFGAEARRSVNRRRLCEIVQARMEEILEMVGQDVRRAGLSDLAAAGLVLTGGAANLEGIEQLATEVLHMPVRVAYPHEVSGKTDIIINPAFATSIGLLSWAAREHGLRPGGSPDLPERRPRTSPDALNGWVRKLQVAVRAMLP